jgi:excisionase family DNA binding protein
VLRARPGGAGRTFRGWRSWRTIQATDPLGWARYSGSGPSLASHPSPPIFANSQRLPEARRGGKQHARDTAEPRQSGARPRRWATMFCMAEDRLLTLDEVAERTGLSRDTLYQMRHRGEGPASLRLSNRVRVKESALAAWLAQSEAAEQERLSRIGA